MSYPEDHVRPDRKKFAADPFGYSAFAWHRWCLVQEHFGFAVNPDQPPTSVDLKSPVLWLSQASALTEAATILLRAEPRFEQVPVDLKGICDSQYCAAALMLVGFSLEVSLKAMLIIKNGTEAYMKEERRHHHHRLEELAEIVPDINQKDRAILRNLSRFVAWAGRYPDPGAGRLKDVEEIFAEAELHRVSASDLFHLAGRVMAYARKVVG